MNKYTITQAMLDEFIGSTDFYVHPVFGYRYTEGAAYLAKNAGAFWLLDAIHSWQCEKKVRDDLSLQEIQFWKLAVRSDETATLTCSRDGNDVVVKQAIDYTDFPLESVVLYYIDGLILLPTEY